MIGPEIFFDLTEFEYKGVFSDTEFVWEALINLKSYLKDNLAPNVSCLGGKVLSKTSVLWNGEVIERRKHNSFILE